MYKRLSEVLGLNDEIMLLSVISRKIITNLKFWGHSEQIIRRTLNLLNDLTLTYSLVRRLIKLEEIQFMLNNHTSEHFSFLGSNCILSGSRCRSLFYTCLGRLLMVDLGEDVERFITFMSPLTSEYWLTKRNQSKQLILCAPCRCIWFNWKCNDGYEYIP